jgi:hypothetical protein
MTDVPANRVPNIIKGFEVQGCKNIKKTEQPNKRWTVEADCPNPPKKDGE